MPFIQLSKISLAFGDRDILKDVTLILTAGTKAALTGANGCGKSTLMKIVAGQIKADSGEIASEKDTSIAYLPQSGIVHKGKTLAEEAETAFAYGYDIIKAMDEVGEKMKTEKDEQKLLVLANDYHALQTRLENSGWNSKKGLIDETLRGLGFSSSDFNKNVQEFSGGWQMRIALAKVLLQNSDIIVLDEPTNYLDIEARSWLELWLKKFKGGFLLVSHDRYFLDQTVNETYELFKGNLKKYKGTYSDYERIRTVEVEGLIKAYEQQQEEIAKTEDFIRKFRYTESRAALVQDRIRRLEKMERIELPEHLKKIRFSFPPAPHSGKIVLQAEGISKAYRMASGTHRVIENLDLTVEKGERLVLAGKNGAGKSTLLRILAGEDKDFTGNLKEGAGVKMGYFSQDESETITGSESIIDLLERSAPTELVPKLYDMLAAFLFRGDDIYKSLSVLSGGEKSRLALLLLLLKPLNLLILDEPTNHLDLHSKDVLLDALKRFDGTVIFVSHDKGFIQDLATRVLELKADEEGFRPSRVRNFPGTYDYYLYRIEQEKAEDDSKTSVNGTKPQAAAQPASSAPPKKASMLSYEEQKKLRSERRKLEKEEERLLTEIEKCEAEIAENEALLAEPEVYSNGEKSKAVQKKIEELRARAEELSESWAEAAGKLENSL
ncbi:MULTISPECIES: ABC-F family ATP-binding cassette domain-containing protein [unclassified Treponema]|uniref:ABC-F family ATP-binding cassette domain-containing protein n=1 Tax=unclassified Treponema TaxID=2638727 RepID=UPI0020A46203|nr:MULTISPECIES: ABC-F family ATP-binding cassette domain-containing protein [unclassified Treponema]UTC68246.1 ABC-F family ATP-binding cassette domain-containing protein [Treponema sp. OMZ 789]UTC70966.1 ABC-F family ATP-binding cassette domain-containing protein [Treponema sp. OMZ 790]UTC73706.1 ABC-F family ATP-binding cassette domain-containing protein [Treponema sp. OMZ 791]